MSQVVTTPVLSLPPEQYALLRKCVPPRMYILLLSQSLCDDDIVNYEIEVGVQRGQIVFRRTVHKRFSELHKYDQKIRGVHRGSKHLREFPPKAFFAKKKKKELLDERYEQLRCYLGDLPLITGIVGDAGFQEFFEIDPMYLSEL